VGRGRHWGGFFSQGVFCLFEWNTVWFFVRVRVVWCLSAFWWCWFGSITPLVGDLFYFFGLFAGRTGPGAGDTTIFFLLWASLPGGRGGANGGGFFCSLDVVFFLFCIGGDPGVVALVLSGFPVLGSFAGGTHPGGFFWFFFFFLGFFCVGKGVLGLVGCFVFGFFQWGTALAGRRSCAVLIFFGSHFLQVGRGGLSFFRVFFLLFFVFRGLCLGVGWGGGNILFFLGFFVFWFPFGPGGKHPLFVFWGWDTRCFFLVFFFFSFCLWRRVGCFPPVLWASMNFRKAWGEAVLGGFFFFVFFLGSMFGGLRLLWCRWFCFCNHIFRDYFFYGSLSGSVFWFPPGSEHSL